VQATGIYAKIKDSDEKLESEIGVFDYGKSYTISESWVSRISRQTRRMVFAKGKRKAWAG